MLLSIFIQGIGAVFLAAARYLNRKNAVGKAIEKLCVFAIAVPTFIVAGIIMEIFANQFHMIRLSNNVGLARYLPAAVSLSQSVLSILPTFLQMMGLCFAGSLIVEQIFGLPGIGALLLNSVLARDAPMIHGIVFFMGVIIAAFSMIADGFRKAGAGNEA